MLSMHRTIVDTITSEERGTELTSYRSYGLSLKETINKVLEDNDIIICAEVHKVEEYDYGHF